MQYLDNESALLIMDCTVLLIKSLNRQKGLRRNEHEINERLLKYVARNHVEEFSVFNRH